MTSHLARIDLLRGLAITLVLMHHYMLVFTHLGVRPELAADLGSANAAFFVPHQLGYLGVSLFFVISGFCIHNSYLGWRRKTRVPTPSGFLLHYLNRRFWRIYPPYLLALLVAFLLVYSPVYDTRAWRHLAIHLTLGNTLSQAFFFNINAAFWSVAVEWQLYLIYPLVLWFSRHLGPVRAVLLATGIALFWRFALPALTDNWALIHLPFRWWFEWCLGFLLAEQRARGRIVVPRPALCTAVLLPSVVALYLLQAASFWTWLLTPLAFASLLQAACHSPRPLTRFERGLCTVGVSSYSMYLFHNPVLWVLRDLLGSFATQLPPWVVWIPLFLGVFALTQLLSSVLFRWIEQPSIRTGQYLERTRFPRWFPALTASASS